MAEITASDVTALTVQLLSAFVSKNDVSSEELANLIRSTRAALTEDLAQSVAIAEPSYSPAVSVRKSLSSPDHILSLIDGKPYKTLKRHLTANGLTEKEYRERYNLPASYPMVAPNYSLMRRAVAESNGLGRKPTTGTTAPDTANASNADALADNPTPAKQRRAPGRRPGRSAAAKPDASAPQSPVAETRIAEKAPSGRGKLSMFGAKTDDAGASAEKPKAGAKALDKPKSSPKRKSSAGSRNSSSTKASDEPTA